MITAASSTLASVTLTVWVVVPPRSSVTVTSKLSLPNQSGSLGVKLQAPVSASITAVPWVAAPLTVKYVPSVRPSTSVAFRSPPTASPSSPV